MRLLLQPGLAAEAHAWDGARASVTVVVKAAFALTRPALGPPQPRALGEGDRVPWKASPEVLVVGSARAPTPQRRVAVRVGVGDWFKRCEAVADEATTTIPLRGRLRDERGSPTFLGPQRPGAVVLSRFDPGMDTSAFNAAAPDQHLPSLEAGTLLSLHGLVDGGAAFEAALPPWRPSAAGRTADGQTVGLPLRCDTLWIDTDAMEAVLLWRGLWTLEPRARPDTMFVAAGNVALDALEVVARVESMRAPAPASAPTAPGRGTVLLEDEPAPSQDETLELPPSLCDDPTVDIHSVSPETLAMGMDVMEESTVPDREPVTLDASTALPDHLRELLDAMDHDGARTVDAQGVETLNVSEGATGAEAPPVHVAVVDASPTADGWVESRPALELYAHVQAALDAGADVDALLPRHGLDGARWQALRLHWTRRARQDPAVARELERLLAPPR